MPARISCVADVMAFECFQTRVFDRGIFSDVRLSIQFQLFSSITALVSVVTAIRVKFLLCHMSVGIIAHGFIPGIAGVPGPLFRSLILEH